MTDQAKLEAILDKAQAGKRLTQAERDLVEHAKTKPTHFATLSDVAAHYGVVRSSLDRWRDVHPAAFSPEPEGYNVALIEEARTMFLASGKNVRLNKGDLARANQAKTDENGSESADLEQFEDISVLKARKMHLECQKLATQIDILQGKYALIDDIMEQLRAVIYTVKEKIDRLGPELAYEVSGVSPAEAEERINKATEKILFELSEEDYSKVEEALRKPKDDFGEQSNRLPAARDTNGRQA